MFFEGANARKARFWIGFFSLILILQGSAALYMGRPYYRNYWGGPVFPPAAIVIGLLGLWIVVKNPPGSLPPDSTPWKKW
jgi:hypothetical protein